jgi:hypothetical protein
MPDELLLDLDKGKGIDLTLVGIEELRQLFVKQVAKALEMVPDLSNEVYRRWKQLCAAVVAGHLEQVHHRRPEFKELVEARLEQVKHAHQLASMAAVLGDEQLLENTDFPHLIEDLERFRNRVFTAWETAEDLEDLAAADYHLPAARLKALCNKYPPPQSWYEEEGKLF